MKFSFSSTVRFYPEAVPPAKAPSYGGALPDGARPSPRRGAVAAAVGAHRAAQEAIHRFDFEETARLYRLIDQDAINVVVPWDPAAFQTLEDGLRQSRRPAGSWLRRARPHTVNLYRPKLQDPIWAYLNPVFPSSQKEDTRQDWFVLLDEKLYDREMLGLTGAPDVWIA